MVGEKEVVFEVRSSELSIGLSSSDDPVEAKVDIAASSSSLSGRIDIRSFHALRKECALDADTLFRFRDRF